MVAAKSKITFYGRLRIVGNEGHSGGAFLIKDYSKIDMRNVRFKRIQHRKQVFPFISGPRQRELHDQHLILTASLTISVFLSETT